MNYLPPAITLLFFIAAGILLTLFLARRAQAQVVTVPVVRKADWIDLQVMVETQRVVENWDGRTAGAGGEWGDWQFKPALWAEMMPSVAQRGATAAEERTAATQHILRIMSWLPELNQPHTPISIALIFKAGYGAVKRNKWTRDDYDYAIRSAAIYHELMRKKYGDR